MPAVIVISHTGALWGAQLRLCESARPLGERGFSLTLAAPPGGPLEAAWSSTDRPFVPLELPTHDGGVAAAAAATARSTPRLARLLRDYDLAQSHSTSAHLEVALAGRATGTPVVLDVHDVVTRGVGRRALRAASRLASVTVANSTTTAETIGTPDIRVVFPGVDVTRFAPGPADPRLREALAGTAAVPLVGILGRVDPVKGIEHVVEAVASLDGEGGAARLVVVGDSHRAPPGYAESLKAMARRRLGDRVRFVGARSDIPDVLRALDIVVGPWRVEPFGRSVAEAQASGLPVVAPAQGGPREVVSHGESGFLVDLADHEGLRRALAHLIGDPDLRARMGAEGRRRICERFSFEAQTARTILAYEAALGDPAGVGSRPGAATSDS